MASSPCARPPNSSSLRGPTLRCVVPRCPLALGLRHGVLKQHTREGSWRRWASPMIARSRLLRRGLTEAAVMRGDGQAKEAWRRRMQRPLRHPLQRQICHVRSLPLWRSTRALQLPSQPFPIAVTAHLLPSHQPASNAVTRATGLAPLSTSVEQWTSQVSAHSTLQRAFPSRPCPSKTFSDRCE